MKKLIILPGILALFMFVFLSACDNGSDGGTRLVGIVTITGIPQVGEYLTASTVGLGGGGTPSFQWNIVGGGSAGTGNPLLLTAAHEGQRLTVTVTRAGYSGSVTSGQTDPIVAEGDPPPTPWPPTQDIPVGIFHNEEIEIIFSILPDGATIWYTTDGTHPGQAPPASTRTQVTDSTITLSPRAAPGIVRVRWFAERPSHAGTLTGDRLFQIFTPVAFPGHTGPSYVYGVSDVYTYEGTQRQITVNLTVVNGFITNAEITTTYDPGQDDGKSEEYVWPAIAHAEKFLEAMNSTEIDVLTAPTAPWTTAAIREAANRAIANLP